MRQAATVTDHGRGSGWMQRGSLALALAATLACRANGSSILPILILWILQIQAVAVWGARKWRTAGPARGDLALMGAVSVMAFVVVGRRGVWSYAWMAPVLFVLGLNVGGYLQRAYLEIDAAIDNPRRVLRRILGPWALVILCGSILLSLPIATNSGVPDYAHNFWLHAVTSAFTAVSAACLVGNSIYSMGEDFTRFGQGVTLLIVELAGLGFAAVALSIVRPLLRRPVRLATIYKCIFVAQCLGFAILLFGWPAIEQGGALERVWTCLFYTVAATFNAGFTLKASGLVHEITAGPVFLVITSLAILGSIGWPWVVDVARLDGGKPSIERRSGLAEWDIFAALILLLGAAGLLLVLETPGSLPANLVAGRPVDFGSSMVSIRDQMPLGRRWSLSVFVSATLRSSGFQSIPLSYGGISFPGFFLMLLLMIIGGSAAGVAGGLRTTTVTLPAWLALSKEPSLAARRKRIIVRSLLFVPLWILGNVFAMLLLRAVTDGTWYEISFESIAAWNSVGLSTGLSLHLTTLGRLVMIILFAAGRLAPIVYWMTVLAPAPTAGMDSEN